MTRASRCGDTDGAVNALVRPEDYDPRGRFIRRTELPEATWREYEIAFEAAFRKTQDTFGRRV